MAETVDRTIVLMDGPPARVPERVAAGMPLRGRRLIVNAPDGRWVHDVRAVDDAYLLDPDTHLAWLPGTGVPNGADESRAVLTVAACTEQGWYDWARTKRRPEVVEYPAYLVWAE